MAAIHCLQDVCTDSPTCPCPCEDCYHAKRDQLMQPNETTKPEEPKKMSALIGRVVGPGNPSSAHCEVWCSRAGVEVHQLVGEDQVTLDPIAARNYAALLVRASEEVERMRREPEHHEPERQSSVSKAPNYIRLVLESLMRLAWRDRLNPLVWKMAQGVTQPTATRRSNMEAIVAELHRRYPAPQHPDPYTHMDSDDVCAFVAAAAMSIGIRCRFVGLRFGDMWTCELAFEDYSEGGIPIWESIDPLRRTPGREPDEKVMGPLPEMPGHVIVDPRKA